MSSSCPIAEAEIEAAFVWYRERNPQAAVAFRTEAFACIEALAEDPNRWRHDEDGTQRCLLRHFPYTVYYLLEGQAVFALAVAHRRRAPGYWRQR